MKNKIVALVLVMISWHGCVDLCAKDLIVPDGRSQILQPGDYSFDRVDLGANAILYVTGTTSIYCDRVYSADGARIAYKSGSAYKVPNKKLTFLSADGRGIRGTLHFIGDGKDGRNGHNGNVGSEGSKTHFKLTKGYKNATKGGTGGKGQDGEAGEHAMSFYVAIGVLSKDSFVAISSKGGRGGNGGTGGTGGRGGRGDHGRRGADGGDGGRGGSGGKGGDGGKIFANLAYPDAASDRYKRRLREFVEKHVRSAGGQGGARGERGDGGNHGDGGRGDRILGGVIKRGPGGGGRVGSPGKIGKNGASFPPVKGIISATEFRNRAQEIKLPFPDDAWVEQDVPEQSDDSEENQEGVPYAPDNSGAKKGQIDERL